MLHPIPTRDVTWTEGFWADKWKTLQDRMIPSVRRALDDQTNAAWFPNFVAAANLKDHRRSYGVDWSDGDCYKYLETLVLVYAQTGDQALKAELDEKISIIAAAQDSDGYISTNVQLNADKERWSDTHNHELYNMGHLLTSASVHHDVTGERVFLDVAIRLADYLYRTFQPRPVELAHYGWNPSNIMGLVDLYRATSDERYLELAGVFVDMRGAEPGGDDQNQDFTPLRREAFATGHAVTGPYLYGGAADIVAETGEEELLTAITRIWDNATQRRMYITGGIGSNHFGGTARRQPVHESFGRDYELPNASGYNETCANISLAMWGLRMAGLTGEARYTDVVERVMFNAGISGVSVDGDTFCYTNPLRWYGDEHDLSSNDAMQRWATFTCYCCPVQVIRTMAHMHEWVYGLGEGGLWVHQFAGSKLSTTTNDGSTIALEQTTNYPWDGAVKILISEAPAGPFNLHLRIPEWSDGTTVSVNGEPLNNVTPGTYLDIERTWAAGDSIEIDMPMEPTLMAAHHKAEEARNQVAVVRGPVVYCLESVDLPDGVSIENVHMARDATIEATHEADLLGGVTVLKGSLVHRPGVTGTDDEQLYVPLTATSDETFDGQLVPYYAWNNRGLPYMSVWLPTA